MGAYLGTRVKQTYQKNETRAETVSENRKIPTIKHTTDKR